MSVILDILSWLCLTAGSIFCVIGAIGLLRMPDFYTRTHAASVTDTLGAGLIILGLMFHAEMALVVFKLFFIIVFMLFINPGASHGLVKAAFAQGIKVSTDEQECDKVDEEGTRVDSR